MAEMDFRARQYAFAAHLRDPARHAAPEDVAPERVAVYRELMYRNVDEALTRAFPVLHALLAAPVWQAMVEDYFVTHRACTPLYPRMAEEFLAYLDAREMDADWPPFVQELARYEWAEADVLFDPQEIADCRVDAGVALLDGRVVPNPVLRAGAYRFPVHRIGPDYQPRQAPTVPTYLVVYRRRDDSAGFVELNAVAARLLELILLQDGRNGRQLLESIARELKHPSPAAVIEGGRDILQTLVDKDIVLGARA
jgi:hypothetical protein